jgi:hypothetical protein
MDNWGEFLEASCGRKEQRKYWEMLDLS